jgi:hypothetical protein
MMVTEMRPTITGLLIDGFNAIKLETLCNKERGEATDTMSLLRTLHLRIKECLGYDYPVESLDEVYGFWTEGNQ